MERDDGLRRSYEGRDRDYNLSRSEIATIQDVGRFRVVITKDLAAVVYRGQGQEVPKRSLRHLKDQKLIRFIKIPGKDRTKYVTLTRADRDLVKKHFNPSEDQGIYCGVGKLREIEHNSQLYRVHNQERLVREADLKRILINEAYTRQMIGNTRSFQQLLIFEVMKIDPRKSAFDYEPHEKLACELVREAAEMRMDLVRLQITISCRKALRLSIDHKTFMELMAAYKQLEHEMVNLATFADSELFRLMLIERLGMDKWGLFKVGSDDDVDGADPEPA